MQATLSRCGWIYDTGTLTKYLTHAPWPTSGIGFSGCPVSHIPNEDQNDKTHHKTGFRIGKKTWRWLPPASKGTDYSDFQLILWLDYRNPRRAITVFEGTHVLFPSVAAVYWFEAEVCCARLPLSPIFSRLNARAVAKLFFVYLNRHSPFCFFFSFSQFMFDFFAIIFEVY